MARDFSAAIDEWTRKTEARIVEVFHVAAQTAAETMSRPWEEGGRLPVKTGNLKRSLAASTIGPPAVLWGQKKFTGNPAGIEAVIDSAKIGQTVWLGFQAIYARKVELDNGFVRLTAQNWPQIVEAAAEDVKARDGG